MLDLTTRLELCEFLKKTKDFATTGPFEMTKRFFGADEESYIEIINDSIEYQKTYKCEIKNETNFIHTIL